uniref:Uncharacterized protein n=1 Tax=Rhizophora mucronata TaxID=61149 RepID=A0A2P2KQJ4_RHIMU
MNGSITRTESNFLLFFSHFHRKQTEEKDKNAYPGLAPSPVKDWDLSSDLTLLDSPSGIGSLSWGSIDFQD